jgi:hypothetical protein
MKTIKSVTISRKTLKGYKVYKSKDTGDELIPDGSIFMGLVFRRVQIGVGPSHTIIDSIWAIPLSAFIIKKVFILPKKQNAKPRRFYYEYKLKPVLILQIKNK